MTTTPTNRALPQSYEPARLVEDVWHLLLEHGLQPSFPDGRGIPASAAAGQALWWPPAKIAARYLAPYLATARPQPLEAQLLSDRVAIPGPRLSNAEHRDALELALLLADCDARWGDFRSALHALDAAEGLQGALPPEYEVTAWTDHDEIMGVRHKTWPLEGVQYHPESFLTEQGERLLANFLKK